MRRRVRVSKLWVRWMDVAESRLLLFQKFLELLQPFLSHPQPEIWQVYVRTDADRLPIAGLEDANVVTDRKPLLTILLRFTLRAICEIQFPDF